MSLLGAPISTEAPVWKFPPVPLLENISICAYLEICSKLISLSSDLHWRKSFLGTFPILVDLTKFGAISSIVYHRITHNRKIVIVTYLSIILVWFTHIHIVYTYKHIQYTNKFMKLTKFTLCKKKLTKYIELTFRIYK